MAISPVRIPFNRPMLAGSELEYMADAVARGHISGDGEFTRRCSRMLRELLQVPAVLLTTSCTHALEMSALLLSIGPEDEVIVPSFTFVSTVNAFVIRGATPVFVDIRHDTLNIDERLIESRITPRTKAIVVVHYAGVAAEMDEIRRIADRSGLAIIEDNAHGLFGSYNGRPLGSLGTMATLSFHETKNVHCGEGGAIVLNDPDLLARAEVVREKGTNRSRFFRGEVDKYTWVDRGSSYLPSDLLAAFLCAQLESADRLQSRRHVLWNRYFEALGAWSVSLEARLPFVPPECGHPAHMFYLVMRNNSDRDRFIAHLADREIHAVFHYVPLHSSPAALQLAGGGQPCPATDDISERLVRLPLYPGLTDQEQARVIQAVVDFR